MGEYEKEILETIKNHFDNSLPYLSNDPSNVDCYYLKDFNKNFYEDMSAETKKSYEKGRGSELKGAKPKIAALRSSSAMTYNIFGNYKDFSFEGFRYTNKYFEFNDLPTLINSPAPANMDVFLESSSKLLFFEMKMCEWLFNSPSREISLSYLNPDNYSNPEVAEVFKEALEKLSKAELHNYDALQMFKHSLGIFNYVSNRSGINIKEVELINCIWDFDDVETLSKKSKGKYFKAKENEEKGFNNFHSCMDPVIKLLKIKLDINFRIRKISVSELISKLEISSETEEHKNFLSRYCF